MFNNALVYILPHLPHAMTQKSSLTFDDSFTQKCLKIMNISRYFIRGVKSQICPNIKFYSVRPIFTPILGNMEIETLVLAY